MTVSEHVNRVIEESQVVYMKEAPLAEVRHVRGLHTVNDVVSPSGGQCVN